MPKVSPAKLNFNAGEVSPLLAGRTDIDQYKSALKSSLNGLPTIQGGWTRRPGFRFAAECKNHDEACYLYPFEFGVTQAYMLVFGPEYIRFMRNNALITEAPLTVTGATQTNPVVLAVVGHGLANGTRVAVASVGGMTQIDNREFTVANAAANTFELQGVDGTGYDAYTSGGTVSEIVEIASPYLEDHLFELKFTQSADVLYITHPLYAPRKLIRASHTSWSLNVIDFVDGPYLPTNTTAITVTPTGTTGAITLNSSGALFAATDVGRTMRINVTGGSWGRVKITGFTSATSVSAQVQATLGGLAGTATWRFGIWSDTTGYPAAVTFFEDRLFFGGATANPQRIDGSRSGNYENFGPTDVDGTVVDSHAVAFTLNSNDVNVIRWMVDDEKGLIVGTVGGEWIVRPSALSEPLSPTNISAKQSTTYGSADLPAVKAGKAVLFVNRSRRKLRELAYVFEVDGFRAPDMTVLSEHITQTGVVDIAYQKDPQSTFWLPREDGVLLSFTYDREQQVLAWGRHAVGGYSDSGRTTNAIAESVGAIPSSDGSRDEVYAVVQRYINGGTKRYIECGAKIWEDSDEQEDANFFDSSISYDGSPTSSLSGLWHLEGETAAVWADGAVHPECVVTNGKITLNDSYSKVQVGLDYNSDGELLPFEAGAADGTAQGKTQRIHRAIFRVWETLGLKVGPSFDKLYEPPMRTASMPTDTAVPLQTRDVEVPWEGDYERGASMCFRVSKGAPATILAIYPHMHTQDR